MNDELKTGFVALVGPTNSGKSSLLNAMVGGKVSIVSPRSQTTYHRVCGVANGDFGQMVLVDTPGFQRFPDKVARLLNRVADRGSKDCDVYLWLFDASAKGMLRQFGRLEQKIANFAPKERSFCVLNKVDVLKNKMELLPLIAKMNESGLFSEIVPISVKKENGIEQLKQLVIAKLPVGPAYYPTDQITDRSPSFLVTEFIRESIYRSTKEEIPYSTRVEIESWDSEGKVPTILARIHVSSPSQRKILVGKQGSMLKEIGINSRKSVETMLGIKICLKLYVDIEKDWKHDSRLVNRYLELK